MLLSMQSFVDIVNNVNLTGDTRSIHFSFFRTLDSNNFRPLVSISAITESESVHLNLVVVAATGTRFYFSCTSVANSTSRPQGLQLIHVRLPPGYAANAPVMRPRKVQMAYYRKGKLLTHRIKWLNLKLKM